MASSCLRKMFFQYYYTQDGVWVNVSCNFGHIFLTYYIMADVKPCDIMENIMFKYCGRCFNHNIWQIGLYIVAISLPTCVMADVIAIHYGCCYAIYEYYGRC